MTGIGDKHFDLLFLTLWLSFFNFLLLGKYSLFSPDEARYAEVAREMLVSNNFITPTVNGITFLDKPNLHYWLQALSMVFFGVNEFAIRFFPAFISMIGSLMTYMCVYQLFDRKTALASSLILSTSPLYFIGGHYANLDLEVAVFISISLLLFITGIIQKKIIRNTLFNFSCVFASLAFLTKGLIGIVLPVIIIISWLFSTSQLKKIKIQMAVISISIIFFCITPWCLLAESKIPGFLHYFFVEQQISRFLSTTSFNNQSPFWFYIPVIIVGFFPWSYYLIVFFKKYFDEQENINANERKIILFLWMWISIIILFFSIPKAKIITYILPVFPPCAILCGYHISKKLAYKKFIFLILLNSCILLLIASKANMFNVRGIKPLALKLNEVKKPGDFVFQYYKYFPDNNIYLKQVVPIVYEWENRMHILKTDNWARELLLGSSFQKTNNILVNNSTLKIYWLSDKNVFVFLSDNYLPLWERNFNKYFIIAKYKHVLLVTNHPQNLF